MKHAILLLCLAAVGCPSQNGSSSSHSPAAAMVAEGEQFETTPSGLQYRDLVLGDGASPQQGQEVVVHYTGWLLDGTKFDSSLDRDQAFKFPLGVQAVIAGWDEGVATMQVGGKRKLVIPPELGYGGRDMGKIPANSTLVFEVELLELR